MLHAEDLRLTRVCEFHGLSEIKYKGLNRECTVSDCRRDCVVYSELKREKGEKKREQENCLWSIACVPSDRYVNISIQYPSAQCES